MTNKSLASAAFAFIAGCAAAGTAARLVFPPAKAADTQRWEQMCVTGDFGMIDGENATTVVKPAGSEGWELVGFQNRLFCFKRPMP